VRAFRLHAELPAHTPQDDIMKKTILFLLIMMAFAAACARAQQPAKPGMAGDLLPGKVTLRDDYVIVVDNNIVVTPDVPPVESDGVIFVSLRFVGEALGAKVDWDAAAQTVTLNFGDSKVVFTIGKKEAARGDETAELDAAPFLYQARAMVPLKFSAEAGGFKVQEAQNAITLQSPKAAPPEAAAAADREKPKTSNASVSDTLKQIRDKAKNDSITKKLKPYVFMMWALAGLLWIWRLIGALKSDEPDRFKALIVILVVLAVGVPCIFAFMLSTAWAAMVPIIACIVGLVSTEEYGDKIVTMANTAQGAGLICTLFGLGLLIGPAIANRDIHAIGYGIYVKIEPTITGLALSIIMSMLFSYESRKRRNG